MRALPWLFGAFIFAISGGAQAASPAAFRGLDGNSRAQDVLSVFPAAKQDWVCQTGETEQRSSEGVTSCEELTIYPYRLNDTDFTLTFMFNLDGTLRYISILKIIGSYARADSGVERSAIERVFRNLIEPLSAKFGPGVDNAPGNPWHSNGQEGRLEWQPGNGRIWREGVDRVVLTAETRERSKWPGTFVGSVQIWYSFVRVGDVSKF